MKAWVNTLSIDRRTGCRELVSFVGSDGVEDLNRVMVLELLVFAKLSPKMQFVCDCAVLRDDGSIEHRVAREAADDSFPFTAKILSRASRLSCTMEASPGIHGVSISTSDELALFLLSHKPHWQLVPLLHDIDVEGPDLLHMDVRGRSEVVAAPAASQRRTTMWKLPEEFDVRDPL